MAVQVHGPGGVGVKLLLSQHVATDDYKGQFVHFPSANSDVFQIYIVKHAT